MLKSLQAKDHAGGWSLGRGSFFAGPPTLYLSVPENPAIACIRYATSKPASKVAGSHMGNINATISGIYLGNPGYEQIPTALLDIIILGTTWGTFDVPHRPDENATIQGISEHSQGKERAKYISRLNAHRACAP